MWLPEVAGYKFPDWNDFHFSPGITRYTMYQLAS